MRPRLYSSRKVIRSGSARAQTHGVSLESVSEERAATDDENYGGGSGSFVPQGLKRFTSARYKESRDPQPHRQRRNP